MISATELARRTRQVLDRVAGGGETVAIERNQVLIARIVPATPAMTAAQALAGFTAMLAPGEGDAWLRDGRSGGFGQTLRDPWA